MLALLLASCLQAPTVELIEFGASWCLPCRQQAPIVKRLEQTGVKVRHVDIDTDKATALRWRVDSVPTVIVLHGGQESRRFVGLQTFETLLSAVKPKAPAKPKSVPALAVPVEKIRRPRVPNISDYLMVWLKPYPVIGFDLPPALPFTPPSILPQPTPAAVSTALDVEELALSRHVRIRVDFENSRQWGSGVLVSGPTFSGVITNKHVVGNGGKITIDDGTEYFSGVECSEHWPRRMRVPDDLALIKFSKPVVLSAPICPKGYEPVAPLYVVGSPSGKEPRVRQTKLIKRWRSQNGAVNMTLTCNSLEGESGGGVYDSKGMLVGIIWGAEANAERACLAVDLTRTKWVSDTMRSQTQVATNAQ